MTIYQQAISDVTRNALADDFAIQKMISARRFINSNYNCDTTLDDMAQSCFVSKFHFIRVFKRYYGRTPNQYLAEVRIDHARKFLKQGMPVSAVCYAVGFSSVTSFTTLYKQSTGTTPAHYRRQFLVNRNFR